MRATTIFISLLSILGIVFLGLQFQGMDFAAMGARALAMTILTIYYVTRTPNRSKLFFVFLLIFTVADIANFLTWNNVADDPNGDFYFYSINLLYMASYVCLILRILQFWDVKTIAKNLKLQLLLLFVLNVAFVYMVVATTSSHMVISEIIMSGVYNFIVMGLLTMSLINYMYHDDNKSMNLLVGGIFIVFSEVIQITYFYVSETRLLSVIYSVFLVCAFLFFYLQSQMSYREKIDYLQEDIKI